MDRHLLSLATVVDAYVDRSNDVCRRLLIPILTLGCDLGPVTLASLATDEGALGPAMTPYELDPEENKRENAKGKEPTN